MRGSETGSLLCGGVFHRLHDRWRADLAGGDLRIAVRKARAYAPPQPCRLPLVTDSLGTSRSAKRFPLLR
jgi:hypothetical protein